MSRLLSVISLREDIAKITAGAGKGGPLLSV